MNFLRAISDLLRFDRTNWKALALCVFAATIFWIFSALNKDYSTNLSFPLQVEFDATKYVAAEPLPSRLIANVNGNGWELLRKSLGLKVPTIQYPLERPTEVRKIPGSALSPYLASQLSVLQLNFIVADTLRFHIEPKVSRKVKLVADTRSVTFKKNFGMTSRAVVLPDTLLLEGPQSYIDALKDTLWVQPRASRISSHFRESVEVLVDHQDFISRNPPVVEVIFEVGAIEEIILTIKLQKPKSASVAEPDLDSVQCMFVIPQQEKDRFEIDAMEIEATFKPQSMKRGDSLAVLPLLTGVPDYARLVRVDSVLLRRY